MPLSRNFARAGTVCAAALAPCCLPGGELAACACAQEPPTLLEGAKGRVQPYGSIDVGAVRFRGVRAGLPVASAPQRATTVTGLGAGGATGSILGLRGGEPLAPGVELEYQAETGFCGVGLSQLDAGGDPYCSGRGFVQRQAWVGLRGRAGSLRAGRQTTLLNQHTGLADAFDNSFLGQVGNVSLLGNNRAGLNMGRVDQLLAWTSPGLGGLRVQAQYSFHPSPRRSAVGGGSGAVLLGAQWRAAGTVTGVDWSRWRNAFAGDGCAPARDYELWLAYASHELGAVRVSAQWQLGTAEGFSGRQQALDLGISASLGRGRLMLSLGRYTDSLAPQPLREQRSDASQYAIGYSLALSARTMVYASAAHIANDTPTPVRRGTDLAVGAAGDVVHGILGRSSSGVAAGLSHRF